MTSQSDETGLTHQSSKIAEESRSEADEIAAVNDVRRTPDDPYEFMSILRMHADLLERKGGGEFRLTNGRKLTKPSAGRTRFETWRERAIRRVIYIPRSKDVVLCSDLLTKDNEFVKLLDLLIRAKEYETLLNRPSWQRIAELTKRSDEQAPSQEDILDLFFMKSLRDNQTPSAEKAAAATGIPASTIKDTWIWRKYRRVFGQRAKNANISPEYLASCRPDPTDCCNVDG
jgi:hypothetical protein